MDDRRNQNQPRSPQRQSPEERRSAARHEWRRPTPRRATRVAERGRLQPRPSAPQPAPRPAPASSAAPAAPQEHASSRAGVARATVTMSTATLTSRITGFIRTWAMAFALGNTVLTSSYQIANNLPTTLFDLVAGGVLSAAFLPVYLTLKNREGERRSNEYASTLMTLAVIGLSVISALAMVFAPQLIWTQTFLTTGTIDTSQAVWFFRFFAIQILFYIIGAITEALLNANREYLWPAAAPIFNNLVVIVTMFGYVPISAAHPQAALIWLAVGTSLGVAAQVFIQVPALRRCGIHLRPRFDVHDPAIREMLRLAVPAFIFTAVNFVGVSVQNAFAMSAAANGPSTLSYARMWYQFPYGVISVALTTAMFTEMADNISRRNWGEFKENVVRGVSSTFTLIIPMAFMLIACAEPLIMLYRAGAFTQSDVHQVAVVLRFWALALPFFSVYMYLYRAFSSLRDLKTVTVVDVVCRAIQIPTYAILVSGIGSWKGIGLAGIAVGDAVFYAVMFFILTAILNKRVGGLALRRVGVAALKSSLGGIAGAVVAYALVTLLGTGTSIGHAFVILVVAGIAGVVVAYGICMALKAEGAGAMKRLADRLLGKLRRR